MNTRTLSTAVLAALAFFACKQGSTTSSSSNSPVVATIGDEKITAEDLKKRLDETSPFLRARYTSLDRKKEFLDNIIRNELLAQEARRQNLDKSPAVQEQMKRAMVQELIRKQLDEKMAGADISNDDLKKFYDAHLDDFVKPERARIFHLFLPAAAADAKARAKARTQAAALLKDIDAREKKGEVSAFQSVAMKESQDKLSAPMGGDLRFLSKDELSKSYSPELANAAFELKNPGEKAGPVETPSGIEIVKLQIKTPPLNRTLDEAKDSIRGRMARERRSREYDEWIKKLHDQAKITVDEAELAKVTPSEVPGQQTGFGGMPGQRPPMPIPMTAAPGDQTVKQVPVAIPPPAQQQQNPAAANLGGK